MRHRVTTSHSHAFREKCISPTRRSRSPTRRRALFARAERYTACAHLARNDHELPSRAPRATELAMNATSMAAPGRWLVESGQLDDVDLRFVGARDICRL